MDKEVLLQETYDSSFKDELEKLSGVKSWVAAGSAAGGVVGGVTGGGIGAISAGEGNRIKGALIGAGSGLGAGAVAGGYANKYIGKNISTILRNREAHRLRGLRNMGKKDFSKLMNTSNQAASKSLKDTGLDQYTNMASVMKNTDGYHRGKGANMILRYGRRNPSKSMTAYPSFQELKNNFNIGGPTKYRKELIRGENRYNAGMYTDYIKHSIADLVRKSKKFNDLDAAGKNKVFDSIHKMREF